MIKGRKTEDRFDYCRSSSVCLSVCLLSVNSAAFWRAEGYVDSTIPFSTTLTPLFLCHITTLPLWGFHPHNSPISFHWHILLYSLKILYNKNRAKGEWKDRFSKRINWRVPRGNRGNTNLTWSKILLNKNIILSNIERRRYKDWRPKRLLHLFCLNARHHIRNKHVNKLVNNTAVVASFAYERKFLRYYTNNVYVKNNFTSLISSFLDYSPSFNALFVKNFLRH